jgi:ribosome-associated heat shock protein Hsp15
VVKTRGLAARLAQSGHVRLNGARVVAAGRPVRVGDVLTVALERTAKVFKVVSLGERRGPAPEARGLYEEIGAATPGDGEEG